MQQVDFVDLEVEKVKGIVGFHLVVFLPNVMFPELD